MPFSLTDTGRLEVVSALTNTQIHKERALEALPKIRIASSSKRNKKQSSQVACTLQSRQNSNRITRKNNGF